MRAMRSVAGLLLLASARVAAFSAASSTLGGGGGASVRAPPPTAREWRRTCDRTAVRRRAAGGNGGVAESSNVPFFETMDRYDGATISRFYERRPLEVAARVVKIGLPIAGWFFNTRVVDPLTARLEPGDARAARRGRELRELIVETGSVTFIKSGQALALRPDVVREPAYARELSALHDAVGTFDDATAFAIVERELGAPPRALFEFPDGEAPVASASIGQAGWNGMESKTVEWNGMDCD